MSREQLISDRVTERVRAILEVTPPIKPGSQFWLDSDAGPSYCWNCAVKARAVEFGLGPPLRDANRWSAQTDLETAFYEGIDGGFDTHSDSAEACTTCGKTLSYILTDEGVEVEVGYYLEAPLICVDAEASYAIDRLTLNAWAGMDRARLLGIAACVNQAWRLTHRAALASGAAGNTEVGDG